MASREEPSGRSEIISRTTAFLSAPSSASACSSATFPPEGASIVNVTVPVVAKSPGRSACRRDSCRTRSVAATSGGSTARSGCVDRIGPAAASAPGRRRGRRRRRAPRPAGAARVTTRAFRQMITGFAPGAGIDVVNVS